MSSNRPGARLSSAIPSAATPAAKQPHSAPSSADTERLANRRPSTRPANESSSPERGSPSSAGYVPAYDATICTGGQVITIHQAAVGIPPAPSTAPIDSTGTSITDVFSRSIPNPMTAAAAAVLQSLAVTSTNLAETFIQQGTPVPAITAPRSTAALSVPASTFLARSPASGAKSVTPTASASNSGYNVVTRTYADLDNDPSHRDALQALAPEQEGEFQEMLQPDALAHNLTDSDTHASAAVSTSTESLLSASYTSPDNATHITVATVVPAKIKRPLFQIAAPRTPTNSINADITSSDDDHAPLLSAAAKSNYGARSLYGATSAPAFANRVKDYDVESGMSEALPDNIKRQQASGLLYILMGIVINTVTALVNTLIYIWNNKTFTILAILSAITTAINAFASPSGVEPKEISGKWWGQLSAGTKILSIAYGFFSFAINAIMNALFFPTALDKIKESVKDLHPKNLEQLDKKSKIKKIIGTVGLTTAAVFFAVCAAFAAGFIAFAAASWLPFSSVLATIFATLAFVTTLAQRFVGLRNLILVIFNFFNHRVATQKFYARSLQNIKHEYLSELENLFEGHINQVLNKKHVAKQTNILLDKYNDPSTITDADRKIAKEQARKTPPTNDDILTLRRAPLTAPDKEYLLIKLCEDLSHLQKKHPDLINDPTIVEYTKTYLGITVDITLAATIGIVAAATFMQKGYTGFDDVSILFRNKHLGFSHLWAIASGLASGVASGGLYASSGMDFRTVVMDVLQKIYKNPVTLAPAIILALANYFASGSMTNIGQGLVNDPENLLGLSPGKRAQFYLFWITVAGAIVNTVASTNRTMLNEQVDSTNVTINNISTFAERSKENVITEKTCTELRSQGLWQRKMANHSDTSFGQDDTPLLDAGATAAFAN